MQERRENFPHPPTPKIADYQLASRPSLSGLWYQRFFALGKVWAMRAGERSVNSLTLIISARLPTSLFLSRLKSSESFENWTWSCNSFSLTAWYHLLVFTLISFVSMQSLTLFFSTFPHTEEEQTNVNDEVRIVSVTCALFYNVIPWHILHVLLPQYA